DGLVAGNGPLDPRAGIELAKDGDLDWVRYESTTPARRKTGAPIIGDLRLIGCAATAERFDGGLNGLVDDETSGIRSGTLVRGVHKGFELAVPATTRPRTLKLYMGGSDAQSRLVARR